MTLSINTVLIKTVPSPVFSDGRFPTGRFVRRWGRWESLVTTGRVCPVWAGSPGHYPPPYLSTTSSTDLPEIRDICQRSFIDLSEIFQRGARKRPQEAPPNFYQRSTGDPQERSNSNQRSTKKILSQLAASSHGLLLKLEDHKIFIEQLNCWIQSSSS